MPTGVPRDVNTLPEHGVPRSKAALWSPQGQGGTSRARKTHWGLEEEAAGHKLIGTWGHLLEAPAAPQILGLSPSSGTAWHGNLDYSCLSPL